MDPIGKHANACSLQSMLQDHTLSGSRGRAVVVSLSAVLRPRLIAARRSCTRLTTSGSG